MSQTFEERLREFAGRLSRLQDGLALLEQLCADTRRSAEGIVSRMKEVDGARAPLQRISDMYCVVVNGRKRIVTEKELEAMRRRWAGTFLLDLPRRTLRVRTGGFIKAVRLGKGGLHWGFEKVLLVGMSHPGISFGHEMFADRFSDDLGIGTARVLSRYVCIVRREIGDSGRKPAYLQTVSVDRSVSSTGQGYCFDPHWDYLVIEGHARPGTEKVTARLTG